MLLIYDDTGYISQAISHGSFDLLKAHYETIGLHTLMITGNEDIFTTYVKNGVLTPRPPIAIVQPTNLTVAANGTSELVFTIADPASVRVAIVYDHQRIADEIITDGTLHFTTPHAGDYELIFAADFPYAQTTLNVKAV
jgi:hypothetical protein